MFGSGGLSVSSSAASGPARGSSGTGDKTFNFGGNPNAGAGLTSVLSNPVFIAAAVVLGGLYLWKRK
jgi:hypothetical protein